ncbi:MAG: tetratricopeptide repeat protein [Myxococcota bacterium]|nr:tetratricopeptide repeat protein [Myxococcota bacterium]
MRTSLWLGILLATSVILVVLPTHSLAQGSADARARELWQNGEVLYEEGRYEDAIAAWERAYELSQRPLLLYNIANALERLARWDEAFERLNQYRAFAPSDEREVLDRRMRSIERRLTEQREKKQEARPSSSSGDGRRVSPLRSVGPKPHPAGVALVTAGAASLTAGGVFTGLALDARAEAVGLCRGNSDTILCPETASQALSNDSNFSQAADIAVVGGAVSLGAGLIFSIVHHRQSLQGRSARLQVLPGAGPGEASLLLIGVF